jgi:toxin CcdB
LLDLQTDMIGTDARAVAPLIPFSVGPRLIERLEPVFEVRGEDHVLHSAEVAARPSALIREQPVVDLSGSDYEILGALGMNFSGF